ncbi:hypothetical protein FRB99_005507 [Tulasnella sp. 403]|nr:hypothetical protein FRB99_005507 [Tulasnella sp. 403]
MGSPINEKDQLPCIMITPSSPVHEHDFQLHYFEPEKLQPGFFNQIRGAFCPTHPAIALPGSPPVYSQYGQAPTSSWSASKRFRVVLLLVAFLFFLLHLLLMPMDGETGLYEAFSSHSGPQHMDDTLAVWETLKAASAVTNAPPVATPLTSIHDIATALPVDMGL